jgi:hypothetical protein
MAFTGKSTYSTDGVLSEIAEDVSDIVSIVSPYETPLLDHLGDSPRSAHSTYHEWLEDQLLPNTDQVDDAAAAQNATFGVAYATRFRVGDQVKGAGSAELMLVTAVDLALGKITVARGYGGTSKANLANGQALNILGNAALEGDESPAARFAERSRVGNWTQIFTAGVRVSGSDMAVRKLSVADELDYQKQERLRELLRDLESTVINGVSHADTPQGSASVRRTMKGIIPFLSVNRFAPGTGLPADTDLTEEQLNTALRLIWEQSSSRIDTIVVNGYQKRRINGFITASARKYSAADSAYRDLVSVYESDFGVCRVILCRAMPADSVLLLDSSRINVVPLAGRSFQYQPLATTGDFAAGELIGEYTVEIRNENAHGLIHGLDVA